MENGKKLPWNEDMGKRIVEMRCAGYTWRQIDQMLFPNLIHKDKKSGSFAGDFAQKYRKDHPEMDGAFSKQLIGGFSATQIVVSLRKFNPFKVTPTPQVVEMFI